MKNFSNLTGVKLLTKNEQKEISGAISISAYCKGPNTCCVYTNGVEICDYGHCSSGGGCIWY